MAELVERRLRFGNGHGELAVHGCATFRSPVRRLLESPQELREQLAAESALLRELARRANGTFSVRAVFLWQYRGLAVVLGRHSRVAEVNLGALHAMGGVLVRRETGGCAVVLHPGILCCSVLVSGPAQWPAEWQSVHDKLGKVAQEAIRALGLQVDLDAWGDFRRGDRKVGGTARRDVAGATLWHASFICSGPLELFDKLLWHPPREPAYRRGRKHSDFVAPLGVTVTSLAHALEKAFRRSPTGLTGPSRPIKKPAAPAAGSSIRCPTRSPET